MIIVAIAAQPPKSPEYVPDAIKGLTTLASILVGFTWFCMSYMISTTKEEEMKQWLKRRAMYVIFFIMISLLILAGAYTDLVNGNLAESFKTMQVSLIIISLLFTDTAFLLAVLSESKT